MPIALKRTKNINHRKTLTSVLDFSTNALGTLITIGDPNGGDPTEVTIAEGGLKVYRQGLRKYEGSPHRIRLPTHFLLEQFGVTNAQITAAASGTSTSATVLPRITAAVFEDCGRSVWRLQGSVAASPDEECFFIPDGPGVAKSALDSLIGWWLAGVALEGQGSIRVYFAPPCPGAGARLARAAAASDAPSTLHGDLKKRRRRSTDGGGASGAAAGADGASSQQPRGIKRRGFGKGSQDGVFETDGMRVWPRHHRITETHTVEVGVVFPREEFGLVPGGSGLELALALYMDGVRLQGARGAQLSLACSAGGRTQGLLQLDKGTRKEVTRTFHGCYVTGLAKEGPAAMRIYLASQHLGAHTPRRSRSVSHSRSTSRSSSRSARHVRGRTGGASRGRARRRGRSRSQGGDVSSDDGEDDCDSGSDSSSRSGGESGSQGGGDGGGSGRGGTVTGRRGGRGRRRGRGQGERPGSGRGSGGSGSLCEDSSPTRRAVGRVGGARRGSGRATKHARGAGLRAGGGRDGSGGGGGGGAARLQLTPLPKNPEDTAVREALPWTLDLKQQLRGMPALPMVLDDNGCWYRTRALELARSGGRVTRVLLQFSGFESEGTFWLPADSERIWRGSYSHDDWRRTMSGSYAPTRRAAAAAGALHLLKAVPAKADGGGGARGEAGQRSGDGGGGRATRSAKGTVAAFASAADRRRLASTAGGAGAAAAPAPALLPQQHQASPRSPPPLGAAPKRPGHQLQHHEALVAAPQPQPPCGLVHPPGNGMQPWLASPPLLEVTHPEVTFPEVTLREATLPQPHVPPPALSPQPAQRQEQQEQQPGAPTPLAMAAAPDPCCRPAVAWPEALPQAEHGFPGGPMDNQGWMPLRQASGQQHAGRQGVRPRDAAAAAAAATASAGAGGGEGGAAPRPRPSQSSLAHLPAPPASGDDVSDANALLLDVLQSSDVGDEVAAGAMDVMLAAAVLPPDHAAAPRVLAQLRLATRWLRLWEQRGNKQQVARVVGWLAQIQVPCTAQRAAAPHSPPAAAAAAAVAPAAADAGAQAALGCVAGRCSES